MPSPIRYPDTTGFRADFSAVVLKLDGQEFAGFKSVEGSRKRSRAVVRGANADPLGKTRGTNEYDLSMTVFTAEFKAFITDHFGPGYGDKQFSVQIAVTENGYDTQDYRARGCTIDETAFSFSQGAEPLEMKVTFTPTKIIFNKVDDNKRPLRGLPQVG